MNDLQPYRSLLGFLILLPLMWAGLRGNQRNAATVAFIFCGIAVWGFAIGSKPFPKTDLIGSLLTLLALSISASLSALIVSAAIAIRRDAETRLLSAQDQLNRQLVTDEPGTREFQAPLSNFD